MKANLILVPSQRMDNVIKNKDKELQTIRLTAAARKKIHVNEGSITIKYNNKKLNLEVVQAFTEDIKRIKELGFTDAEKENIAFVTTATYEKFVKAKGTPFINAWVSEDIETITMGTDPEFLIYSKDGKDIIPANVLLSHAGLLGSDGAMAEFRPAPSDDPDEVISNIKNILLMEENKKIVNEYIFRSACYTKTSVRDYPVGGHIHVGNPAQMLNMSIDNRNLIFKVLNKIMDELIAVPLIKLDGFPEGKNRRINCKTSPYGGYGFFGEYRTAGEGNETRLEHRTLSGVWLTHPDIASAVLGTAKAIIDEAWKIINNNKFDLEYVFPAEFRKADLWKSNFQEWDKFPLCIDMKCIIGSQDLRNRLHSSDPESIDIPYLKEWLQKMEGMSTYGKYKNKINMLYEILKMGHKEIDLIKNKASIQENWLENKKTIING